MKTSKQKFLATLILATFTMLGSRAAQTSELMSDSLSDDTQIAKDIVRQFFIEGYENHNYSVVMECVSDDYIDHSPASARSNSDAVGILKIVQKQFPDLKIKILDIFAENGYVATRIRFEGTHSDTCMGVPATGKYISFEALENFRVCDGKIVESWGYWPDEAILRQLTGE